MSVDPRASEEIARADADIAHMLADLSVSEAFNPKQARVFASLLAKNAELDHRIVSLEARFSLSELGHAAPQRLLNLSDFINAAAYQSGASVDAIKARKPKAEPAISARQALCFVAVKQLGLPVADVARALGGAKVVEIQADIRHAEMRMGGNFTILCDRFVAAWEASQ